MQAAVQTQTLHVAIPGEPSELDPHVINAPPDFRVVPALFEGLVRGHPETLQAVPGVAERWGVSADGLVYTFYLRADARWSNGDPVTASDFVYSFRRALTPSLGSQYTFLFFAIAGAEDYAAGRSTDFAQVGITATETRTLQITLRQPTPYFLEIVANNPVFFPVHPATVDPDGGASRRGTGWTRPERFVGNGPFTVESWRPNEIIVVRKSETYHDGANVRLNAIHFRSYDSIDAQERAFRAGQLHLTVRVPLAKVPAYRTQAATTLSETDMLMVRYLNLNTTRPPLDDARVRRALALALDRRQLAERVFHGAATPAFGVVPPGLPNYPTTTFLTEDVAAARALLAAAGFPEGRGLPALELQVEAGASSQLDQVLQATWRQTLGVEVRIVTSESRVHWSSLQQGNFTLSIGGWVADYPDATAILDLWGRESGWNFTGWTDPDYDRLLDEANRANSADERQRGLQAAESHLLQAMPVIPLWFERNLRLVDPTVRGWFNNALDRPHYDSVYLAN